MLYDPAMDGDFERVLLHRDQIRERVRALAREVAGAYDAADPRLTIVPILSGAVIFLADLIRELPLKMKIALVHVSSYPGATTTGGEPRVVAGPARPGMPDNLAGRHVLIVDDILDSGRTLRHMQGVLRGHEPASLRTAVLLRKPAKAPADVPVEFVGFDIDDLFVVG